MTKTKKFESNDKSDKWEEGRSFDRKDDKTEKSDNKNEDRDKWEHESYVDVSKRERIDNIERLHLENVDYSVKPVENTETEVNNDVHNLEDDNFPPLPSQNHKEDEQSNQNSGTSDNKF